MAYETSRRRPTTYDLILRGLAENDEKQSAIRPLYTWDYIQECTERCPAYRGDTCHYDKSKLKRCGVMSNFLKGVADTIMMSIPEGEEVDPMFLWRVGMHLMPLYQMFGRMKIEEATFSRVIYTDDKGRRKANPIYKEIRSTLKLIERTWKNLNLSGVAPLLNVNMTPVYDTEGDYYEKMMQGRTVKKKIRKGGGG